MPLEFVAVPCRRDNFAYLVHDAASGATALVDAPEAEPILTALRDRGWELGQILITHHHDDHISGVEALRAATGAKVLGAAADRHRLPPLDRAVVEGDRVAIGPEEALVIDVPGHTRGHIAFYLPQSALVFTADSLMAAGCGRLFEGTPEEMWQSLQKLAALPGGTQVCSGHDYLDGNLRFALSLEPGRAEIISRQAEVERMRREGRLPMPWSLDEERRSNPFLRAADPALKAVMGMAGAPDVAVFAAIRAGKDRF